MTPDRESEILKRDAYEAGFKARLDGQSCRENPFTGRVPAMMGLDWHWEQGWAEAARAFPRSVD